MCFFLLLVFFGLVTVLLKIWQRRSAYSLIRLNSLAVYAVLLLLLAAGNWEVWIASYNLQARFRSVDVGFLLNMPGRVLPTLVARRALLNSAPFSRLTPNTAAPMSSRRPKPSAASTPPWPPGKAATTPTPTGRVAPTLTGAPPRPYKGNNPISWL